MPDSFVRITPELLAHLRIAEEGTRKALVSGWDPALLEDIVRSSPVAEAMMSGAQAVAVGGFYLLWPGRASCWMIVDDRITASGALRLFRRSSMWCEEAFSMGVRRLEATVRLDFERGHRWALMHGFVAEGVLRRYDPCGADHVMYSRIE